MTTTAPEVARSGPDGPDGPDGQHEPSAGQVARARWRRSRGILIAVLALAVVAVLLALLQPKQRPDYLDPESAGQQGARALAEIVRQRGTPVTVERSASAAGGRMRAAPGSVLVVAQSERLTPDDLTTLAALPGDRLLLGPTPQALRALAPGVDPAGVATGTFAPGCGLSEATSAGAIALHGTEVYTAPSNATSCYRRGKLPALVRLTVGGATVTVLGSGDPLTNERLTEQGNAALSMNLLSTRSNAVWLLPDPPKPGSAPQRSFGDLVPFGVRLAVLQMFVAVVLLALWRSRRLGPVVIERLPVIVRSAEAVEGRARLYRARKAGDRAAQALRTGALERLTALLGMPRSAAIDPAMASEIVSTIAHRTGHDQAAVGAALYGPPPVDDAELVRLAGFLDDLERQVRNS